MGFETSTMRTGLLMAFRDQDPPALPGSPRPPKPGEEVPPSGITGGTLNHYKISLFVRALYLLRTGSDPALLAVTLTALVAQYRYELTVAWECRGQQCEQISPSHGQQNEGPAWGTLWMALRYGIPDLAAVTVAWVHASLAVSDAFAPPVAWPLPDGRLAPVPGLLIVGMRAYGDETPVGNRCFVRDALREWARNGKPLPRKDDPLAEVDQASFTYAAMIERDFLPDLRELLNEPGGVPPLRFPVQVHRGSSGGRAFRLECPEPEGVQHLAGISQGKIFFAFRPNAPLPDAERWQLVQIIRGASITDYPEVKATRHLQAQAPVSRAPRMPTAADLPTGLRALVETKSMTLEAAIDRALRNRPEFAARWPEAAAALRQKLGTATKTGGDA